MDTIYTIFPYFKSIIENSNIDISNNIFRKNIDNSVLGYTFLVIL